MKESGIFNINLPDGTSFILQVKDGNKIRISKTGWHAVRATALHNQEITPVFIMSDEEYFVAHLDIEERRSRAKEAYDNLIGILFKGRQDDRSQSN